MKSSSCFDLSNKLILGPMVRAVSNTTTHYITQQYNTTSHTITLHYSALFLCGCLRVSAVQTLSTAKNSSIWSWCTASRSKTVWNWQWKLVTKLHFIHSFNSFKWFFPSHLKSLFLYFPHLFQDVLGTVDIVSPRDGSLVFRTCPRDRPIVFQIGSAAKDSALAAAKVVYEKKGVIVTCSLFFFLNYYVDMWTIIRFL